jgi:hypothetical protein
MGIVFDDDDDRQRQRALDGRYAPGGNRYAQIRVYLGRLQIRSRYALDTQPDAPSNPCIYGLNLIIPYSKRCRVIP